MAKKTETQRVKVNLIPAQAMNLMGALTALDGRDKVVGEGANEKVLKVAYKMPFNLRLDLAENKLLLERYSIAVSATRNEIVARHSGGLESLAQDHPNYAACRRELTDLENREHEFELVAIDLEALGAEENELPPSILSALLYIKKE